MATETKLDRDVFLSSQCSKVLRSMKEHRFGKNIIISPEKALRAANIKIRFADTIVRAKYRKVIEESSNKADVMMRIQKEKQLLERRQIKERARIEAEIRAPMLKRRKNEQLALKKMEEEARSIENINSVAEKELVNLCGGSYLARTRWVEVFGLVLKKDDDDDCLEEACDDDHEEGEIY